MTEHLRITVYDDKYTYIQDDSGSRALRYGEKWRDCTGDGFILALAQEIEELQTKHRRWFDRYALLYAGIGLPRTDITDEIYKRWAKEVDAEYAEEPK